MNDRKGNEYHAITIDKQLSSLKVKTYFFCYEKRTGKVVKVLHNPKFTLPWLICDPIWENQA